jgi:hypothetical protein
VGNLLAEHVRCRNNKPPHLMIMRHQINVPRIPNARNPSSKVQDIIRRVLQPIRGRPRGQHDCAEESARLHHQDGLPALPSQQRRIREHTCEDLHDKPNGDLTCRPNVDLIDRMFCGLKPERKNRLVCWEATLNEEIAQGKEPKLPLRHDAENLGAVPLGGPEGFQAFEN